MSRDGKEVDPLFSVILGMCVSAHVNAGLHDEEVLELVRHSLIAARNPTEAFQQAFDRTMYEAGKISERIKEEEGEGS